MFINFYRIIVVVFLIINCVSCTPSFRNEMNTIIHELNTKPKILWKAGLNFYPSFLKNVSRLMGVLPLNKLQTQDILLTKKLSVAREPLPNSYDVTLKWPECKSVISIRDQSNCGSCWALSTASAFGDRLCIASNRTINKVLSGEYINSCCNGKCGDGCDGGYPEKAWKFIQKNGLCTGGEYGSNEGCQPYSIAPCPGTKYCSKKDNEATPQCYKDQCTNNNYELSLQSDLYYTTKVYSVKPKMEVIMNEIIKNGPVVAAMKIYEDFLYYKSGIYEYTTGSLQGDHAIKLLGWGEDDGVHYWLCANTWGTTWGMNGFFKIRRGINECGIETRITGGLPKL
ncbi:cathepsin B-like cysteine proteinase 4 [Sipha flava]|uniref:Cathepsin B-like cysteine proteinase 4 n=3 Tax=Sipha flava TaxID=143950 RepID=A0A8B8FZF0_9HEMI|nr:cathepsin B-like cysteine proteinase 4 [Sipha flava]